MRAIIIGAGEIGRMLARILSERRNDVVVIDTNEALLEQLRGQLDVLVLHGNGASAQLLKRAGIEHTELLLAVSNNHEANILACSLAMKYGVPRRIARVRSLDYWDDARGLSPESFGLNLAVIPELECAENIFEALLQPALKETVHLSQADAQMVNFLVKPGSPLIGCRLSDFPRADLLAGMRLCAILRYGQLLIPRGNTTLMAFDEVYAAGSQAVLADLIEWADPRQQPVSRVVLAGATPVGQMLAAKLAAADIRLTLIEANAAIAERAADTFAGHPIILCGDPNDRGMLEEAGIDRCDAFIAATADNENNILSCLLARRMGAGKIIAVTNHLDYLRIIAGITMIDCGFSPLVSAVNTLIQQIGVGQRRTMALLKRVPAEVLEMTVQAGSAVAGKRIREAPCPDNCVFCLILREGQVVAATGDAELRVQDRVAVFTPSEGVAEVEKLFAGRGAPG